MAKNRYEEIVEAIFSEHYRKGANEVLFNREDIVKAARQLGIGLPKNLGDVVYSFRYRNELPRLITRSATQGKEWIIRPKGRSKYSFVLVEVAKIRPNEMLVETKIPDATPGVIERYSLSDEQSLLAKLRYNRLVDVFTGLACYSLQSHLRTTIPGMGQVETDELYVGIDKRGVHYILPVQAKGGNDQLGIVQIEQDFALCASKFPQLVARPIAAQFLDTEAIALFEFEKTGDVISISSEKHYRLVPTEDLTEAELKRYRSRQL